MRKQFRMKLSVERTTMKTLTDGNLQRARGGDDGDPSYFLCSYKYCGATEMPTCAETCGGVASHRPGPTCPRETTDTLPGV